ncbi:antibiotic biosynthesis monooxygenase [Leeia sp.]|uniref:antibiotic biosynthesis monooxygenase family protein n=1 Tax=Leeia sp. TaxID=2884678 RepID=UPI0035AF3D87
MIAVIFEVWLDEAERPHYLQLAAELAAHLQQQAGFISVERFASLVSPDKLLSLSFWEDEAAVVRWRNHLSHRQTQAAGRAGVFRDYRLRVASVSRDYGLNQRAEAPADSLQHHDGMTAPDSRGARA